jgi:hypothetical protein
MISAEAARFALTLDTLLVTFPQQEIFSLLPSHNGGRAPALWRLSLRKYF